jgi:hypothetical protein
MPKLEAVKEKLGALKGLAEQIFIVAEGAAVLRLKRLRQRKRPVDPHAVADPDLRVKRHHRERAHTIFTRIYFKGNPP